jgi:hypothetical protein
VAIREEGGGAIYWKGWDNIGREKNLSGTAIRHLLIRTSKYLLGISNEHLDFGSPAAL